MRNFFSIFKRKRISEDDELFEEAEKEYVELDTSDIETKGKKLVVRNFSLTDFTDVKPIIDSLREGNTIAIVNIKPLKEKDMIELKRSINKIKKVVDAINGDIAGIGEDYIVATPESVQVYRTKTKEAKKPSKEEEVEEEEETEDEDISLY
ncbi:MAG: cell division protein SepF [Candidatus Woesearchaeota archaeon]